MFFCILYVSLLIYHHHQAPPSLTYSLSLSLSLCRVGWGCRIHRLQLCREVKPHNECPWYDTKQSDGEVPEIQELWGMRSTLSLPWLSGLLWPRMVETDRVLSLAQIEVNCVLKLNWNAWNRTIFISKLRTYAKLNCLKWNCFCMLNWIVWNRSVLTFNCE